MAIVGITDGVRLHCATGGLSQLWLHIHSGMPFLYLGRSCGLFYYGGMDGRQRWQGGSTRKNHTRPLCGTLQPSPKK
jgi:hypothetical protein